MCSLPRKVKRTYVKSLSLRYILSPAALSPIPQWYLLADSDTSLCQQPLPLALVSGEEDVSRTVDSLVIVRPSQRREIYEDGRVPVYTSAGTVVVVPSLLLICTSATYLPNAFEGRESALFAARDMRIVSPRPLSEYSPQKTMSQAAALAAESVRRRECCKVRGQRPLPACR